MDIYVALRTFFCIHILNGAFYDIGFKYHSLSCDMLSYISFTPGYWRAHNWSPLLPSWLQTGHEVHPMPCLCLLAYSHACNTEGEDVWVSGSKGGLQKYMLPLVCISLVDIHEEQKKESNKGVINKALMCSVMGSTQMKLVSRSSI